MKDSIGALPSYASVLNISAEGMRSPHGSLIKEITQDAVRSALIESRKWMKKAMAVILTGHEKAWGTEMLVPVGTGKACLERGIFFFF